MLRFALPLLLLVAGCDTLDTDVASYDGVIEVSVAEAEGGAVGIRLVAVDDISCGDPLATALDTRSAAWTVEVVGIVRPTGPTCLAIIPSSAVVPLSLGPAPGRYTVEVAHAGAVDLYTLDLSGEAAVLTAVRTSTTRLAE